MSGGSNIRAVGPGREPASLGDQAAEDITEHAQDEAYVEEEWVEEEPAQSPRFGGIFAALAISAIIGWTGFYVWAHVAEIRAGGTPAQWTDWLVAWTVPTVLVVAIWLLAMRTSTREARRFGEIANMLNSESAQLEGRLATINRELSLAREFLASQSRELDSLGRVAGNRLSEHADRLQDLIRDNGQQVEAIAGVSQTALDNMNRLRGDLPVIANSARDMSNQIGNAGHTAHEQLEELVAGFERLNEFGAASERQVGSLQSRVDAAIAAFEGQLAQMDDLAGTRFDALREKSEDYRAELDGQEVEALASMRRRGDELLRHLSEAREGLDEQEEEALRSLRARLTALRDEAKAISGSIGETERQGLDSWHERIDTLKGRLLEAIDEVTEVDQKALASANHKLSQLRGEAETIDAKIAERDAAIFARIAERQQEIARVENEAFQGFRHRLGELDETLDQRRMRVAEEQIRLKEQAEAIAARLEDLSANVAAIADHGTRTQEDLGSHIDRLTEMLANSRDSLAGTDSAVAQLTEASVRLLELLQASVQQTGHELPEAIAAAERDLAGIVERATTLSEWVGAARSKGEDLSSYVIAAQEGTEAITERLGSLNESFESTARVGERNTDEMLARLATISEEGDAVAQRLRHDLTSAIGDLERAARQAMSRVEEGSTGTIRTIAATIADQAGDALDRSLRDKTEAAIAQLDQEAARSSNASREATKQLRDQLAKVNELAGNLEARVARARERAEEQVDNDFARRVALITESLNSNAIDIAKALSTDVADTDWAAYLRGDRGIFTRRAVRLLDNSEAREIAEYYDADGEFRDNVSRYIADFENMLRTLLSTRDGKSLGVTMLSSDMGKLYVALAQSIERLRS